MRSLQLLHPRFALHWPLLGLYRLITALPWGVRDRLGQRLANLLLKRGDKRLGFAWLNLELCFPERSEEERRAMLRRHVLLQTQALLHLGALWWHPPNSLRRRFQLDGGEALFDAYRAGRACILLTPHTVAVDAGTLPLVLNGVRGSGPYKPFKDRFLDYWVMRGRTRFGAEIYSRDAGLFGLAKRLKQGGLAYYIADEDLGPRHAEFVPFFGVTKASIAVTGWLTRLSDALLFPAITFYNPEQRQFQMIIDPPLEPFPSGDDRADTIMTNEVMERLIRRWPEQYMWTFRLFHTQADGGHSPYKKIGLWRDQ